MSKEPAIYIMASQRNGTLYTGVTGYLAQRVWQHKQAATPGFTQRYGCRTLVYYETLPIMREAISREKQIKAGSRRAKLSLIEGMNPLWRDLYDDLV